MFQRPRISNNSSNCLACLCVLYGSLAPLQEEHFLCGMKSGKISLSSIAILIYYSSFESWFYVLESVQGNYC